MLSNILTKILDFENFEVAWSCWSNSLDDKINILPSKQFHEEQYHYLFNLIDEQHVKFEESISNLKKDLIEDFTKKHDLLKISLSSLAKNFHPLFTYNSFSSWTKTNKELMSNHFQILNSSLQHINYTEDFNSLLKCFDSLPNKMLLESLLNSFPSNLQRSLTDLNNNFSSSYQIIKTSSITLSNIHNSILYLPSSSSFDLQFVTLKDCIDNYFKNMGNNDFLFNNFNRILELLSDDELS
jgi:hypothetical protein